MGEAEAAPRRRGQALGLIGLGVVLGLMPLLSGQRALMLMAWLAAPVLMLGMGLLLGRPRLRAGDAADLASLGALCLAGYALFALVLVWPLARVAAAPGTATSILAGLASGVGLFVLWARAPAFALAARASAGAAVLRAASGTVVPWGPSLALAVPLAVVFSSGVALVLWGPALAEGVRQSVAVVHLLAALGAGWLAAGLAAIDPRHAGFVFEPARPATKPLAVVATPVEAVPAAVEEGDADARLLAAAREGRIDAALAALAEGADPRRLPDPGDQDQRSLPVLAAVLSDLSLLRELIARGCDPNQAHAGLTPLIAATRDSWHGRTEAVMMLLANGADPCQADAEGLTPLHHATRSSDAGVAALLLDTGAPLEALDHAGLSPLGTACAGGNWRLARFLLERGASTHPEGGLPALLAAAAGDDDAAGTLLLLKHRARVDATDALGRSALLLACELGNVEIVQALLEAGADRNLRSQAGDAPLLAAARGGHLTVLQRLVHPQLDATVCDGAARSALMLACEAPGTAPELLRLLLDLGVDPALTDGAGQRAVDIAAAAGRWPLVAVLDPGWPLPASVVDGLPAAVPDQAPEQALLEALAQRRFEAAAVALARLPDDPATLSTRLLDYAGDADFDIFNWLLGMGADPGSGAVDADSVLFALLDRGGHCSLAVQRLLERAVPAAGAAGLSRWLAGCLAADTTGRGCQDIALQLLERGADPFASGPAGEPALASAIRLGWLALSQRLLEDGVDPNARDTRGNAPLHLACSLGREPEVRLLVRHGASTQARTADGQTALGLALSGNRRDLAHWLEWAHWQLPPRRLLPADLPSAAMLGDTDAVARLLELGLAVDAVDAQGCTALLRAAGGGHASLVVLLLEAGADPSLTARTGASPLSAAVSMRHPEIVQRLLERGAAVDQPLPGGVTPLMVAAALGLPDMCSRLLAAGADIDCRDEQGYTALHCAALYAFGARERKRAIALLDTLLLGGAEPDSASDAGHTPLLLALGARAEPGTACEVEVVLAVLDRLIEEDARLGVQDPRGFAPLHLAALHGLLPVVQRLLAAGADPTQRDQLQRTPNDIALLRGFVDVAAEFEPVRSNITLARFLKKPQD